MVTTTPVIREIPSPEKTRIDTSINFVELLSFCPHCKNMQPLIFSHGESILSTSIKAAGGYVYYDYGLDIPHDLYR